jgi:hypothetical protein
MLRSSPNGTPAAQNGLRGYTGQPDRRTFLNALTRVFGVTLLACCEKPGLPESAESKPGQSVQPKLEAAPSRSENAFDGKIKSIEEGFGSFSTSMAKKMENYPNKEVVLAIEKIFELFRENTNYVHKNAQSRDQLGINNVNPGNFSFHQRSNLGNMNHVFAAFAPHSRTVELGQEFEPGQFIDNLALFHEVTHVEDDMKARKMHEQGKIDYDFVLKGLGVSVNSEIRAYLLQIMVLDIYLDGFLSSSFKQGVVLDDRFIIDVASKIGLQPGAHNMSRWQILHKTLELANELWRQEPSVINQNFIRRVIGQGQKPFVVSPDGTVHELTDDNANNLLSTFSNPEKIVKSAY